MKKKQTLVILAATSLSAALVSCGTVSPGEKIDSNKTQIYVSNYAGGYGSEWLSKLKTRFEAAHSEDSVEEGKKGVQIIIDNVSNIVNSISDQILDGRNEVYFTEQSSYFQLKKKGILGDITDAVTAKLSDYGEDKSILDKLSSEQAAFYGIEEDGSTHYYAVPHYSAYFGLTYNIDLFDEKGFYFAKTPTGTRLDDQFITTRNNKKSAGPDGQEGTSDDGLPTTYEEFFTLCEYIAKKDCTPFLTNGHNYKDYLNWLVNALAADYEGKDAMVTSYTLDGDLNLASIVDNELTMDASATTITTENGYETSRMPGKYYAISFLEKILKTSTYHNDKYTNTGYSHTDAQRDFLYAGNDGGSTKPIAMLSDGIWWQNEAKSVFEKMVDSKGEAYSAANRHFGFMPLPKATAEKATEGKTTLADTHFSLCFMKSNVAEVKKNIIKEFIKFANTDESLVEYTITTNTPKALNYSLTNEEKNQMTTFGRSIIELREKADIVYPYANSSFFANNESDFDPRNQYYFSDGSTQIQYVAQGIVEKGYTAATYFTGMNTYYKDKWSKYN